MEQKKPRLQIKRKKHYPVVRSQALLNTPHNPSHYQLFNTLTHHLPFQSRDTQQATPYIKPKINPKMKIILTGTTGFVGTEVLAQALANPHITSLIVLSRKPLPESITANQKVTVKVLDDFLTYPDSLLDELAGAEGCIWYSTPLYFVFPSMHLECDETNQSHSRHLLLLSWRTFVLIGMQ
jgi:hypothetical protein